MKRQQAIGALALFSVLVMATTARADLVHQWTFNGDLRDQVGAAHGTVFGGAALSGNRLSVDGNAGSRFLTAPTGAAIAEKTLVSWVSLLDVDNQSKGSALTLQNNPTGDIFDGIVYAEALPKRWMAGSNGFARTQFPQTFGTDETVEEPGEVMMAIVYDTDNSITLYRNGAVYGSYTKGTLQPFDAAALVQIGPRHGTNADVFEGFVNEARIYNSALNLTEIGDLFAAGPSTTPNPPPPPPPGPELRHQWTFEDGTANDSVGTAHGTLNGGATVVGGRLSLDGIDDFMQSDPIDNTIVDKTLVAWVSLDNLDQRSGSALTLENPTGPDLFDGIVYGERVAGQWMNGSNGFTRSVPDNGGAAETVTEPGEVMIAITYEGNDITIYRDGVVYATAANASQGVQQSYAGGIADVLIGKRHIDLAGAGTAEGNDGFLAGFVNEARIYSGVLSEQDIGDLFQAGPVPEPGSLGLLAIGALALAGRLRRRR